MKDEELFNLILSKQSGISNRGRNVLNDDYKTLNELLRTPAKDIKQILTDTDIRSLIRILVENGREPKHKWLDEYSDG